MRVNFRAVAAKVVDGLRARFAALRSTRSPVVGRAALPVTDEAPSLDDVTEVLDGRTEATLALLGKIGEVRAALAWARHDARRVELMAVSAGSDGADARPARELRAWIDTIAVTLVTVEAIAGDHVAKLNALQRATAAIRADAPAAVPSPQQPRLRVGDDVQV